MPDSSPIPYPPFDSELLEVLNQAPPFLMPVDETTFEQLRDVQRAGQVQIAEDLGKYDVELREHVAPGPRGDIPLISISPRGGVTSAPAIYHLHGGGMVFGDQYSSLSMNHLIEWVEKYRLVVVSVDHRVAPQFPGTAAVEDCQAGLAWTAAHAEELGIDPNRIILAGLSGGGGLAAGTALLNRDIGGPALLAQILWCPQLDDRTESNSIQQFQRATGVALSWALEDHQFVWNLILGEGHEHRDDVSMYAAANRASDLHGLPPAFIDVGSSEPFRDPAVQYASKLWAAGVQAELHVWAGGFHGFDVMFPQTRVAQAAQAIHEDWLKRILSL